MINSDLIKTRILIIGSNGMLGQRLAQFFLASTNIELMCASAEDESFIKNIPYKKLILLKSSRLEKSF